MDIIEERRTIGEHELTNEANNLLDAITAGISVKGYAYAGAGKSTLLRAVEKYHVGNGLYLCYNRSLEKEARKLFKGHNVHIYTGHAFALRSFSAEVKNAFLKRVNTKLSAKDIHEYTALNIEDELYQQMSMNINWKCLFDIAELYFSTASTELKEIHIPKKTLDLIGKQLKTNNLTPKFKPALISYLLNRATELINEMLNPHSNCPTTHDAYVKYWQLSNPVINYDYCMFDEAQDGSPVLLSVLLKQACQQIYVGDKHQSIYQFRGSVNAMDVIPHQAFPLSNSFRYGQQIADLASKILRKAKPNVKITGSGYDTQIIKGSDYNGDEPMLVIGHTNSMLFKILIECYHARIPAILLSGKAGIFLEKLNSLIEFIENGKPTYHSHKKYDNYKKVSFHEKDSETIIFIKLIEEDITQAKELRKALAWSLDITPAKAEITLVTAHMSKGLEYDTVMLCDDFYSAIAAFKNGKPLDESELNLLYVAITRPKKTLILPDQLFDALEENLAFELNIHKPLPCLVDNLIPGHLNNKDSAPRQKPNSKPQRKPVTSNKSSTRTDTPPKTEPSLASPDITKKKHDTKKPTFNAKKTSNIAIEVGQDKKTGKPLYWKPTDTSEFLNPNIAILGTMGTGKTQTVQSLLKQIKDQENLNTDGESLGVLIFDYKDDYVGEEFVKSTNAVVIETDNIPINPFALFGNQRLAPSNTARTFISTMSKVFKLGNVQEQNLHQCIMAAYEQKGIDKKDPDSFSNSAPTLRDVYAIFNSQDKIPQDSLNKALYDLHDAEIFESNGYKCKTLYEALEGRVVVIRLGGGLNAGLQNLVVSVLLDQFYAQMSAGGKPKPKGNQRALKKLILVDEADNFLSKDFESTRKILKEGREFGVGMALSTQSLTHFKTKENDYSLYQTAWICHRLPSPTNKEIGKLFNMKNKAALEEKTQFVGTLEKHHSFFINGRGENNYQESTAFWKLIEAERKE